MSSEYTYWIYRKTSKRNGREFVWSRYQTLVMPNTLHAIGIAYQHAIDYAHNLTTKSRATYVAVQLPAGTPAPKQCIMTLDVLQANRI